MTRTAPLVVAFFQPACAFSRTCASNGAVRALRRFFLRSAEPSLLYMRAGGHSLFPLDTDQSSLDGV
jgi:hypothetical protein